METILREAIKARLAETGQSVNSLAREAGIDEGYLSRFLRKEKSMGLPTADKLCKLLGLELRPRELERN